MSRLKCEDDRSIEPVNTEPGAVATGLAQAILNHWLTVTKPERCGWLNLPALTRSLPLPVLYFVADLPASYRVGVFTQPQSPSSQQVLTAAAS
jgi:hypothetical protein